MSTLIHRVSRAWAGVILVCGFGCASNTPSPLTFNQLVLEREWDRRGFLDNYGKDLAQCSKATTPSTSQSRRELARTTRPVPSLDDQRSILLYVLAHAPRQAIVYPTERYFYYTFDLEGRRIGGNLRFTDAESSVLHIGYFDVENPHRCWSASFAATDGVVVSRADSGLTTVTAEGITRSFLIDDRNTQPPAIPLIDTERVITAVLDESGMRFVLLYNDVFRCFYFVATPNWPSKDSLRPIANTKDRLFADDTTGFVYLHTPRYDRLTLVGVAAENIARNNYCDGPFDQVPPRLSIRKELEAAYPYVSYRGGIDDHGNFLELKDQRVAISPYQAYGTLDEMAAFYAECRKKTLLDVDLWYRLTYEPKRDFNPAPANTFDVASPAYYIQGWPANHHATQSATWPQSHQRLDSLQWPPDHIDAVSSGRPPTP
jgi:hypothetical protein